MSETTLSKNAKKRLAAEEHNKNVIRPLPTSETRDGVEVFVIENQNVRPSTAEREELEALSKEVFGSTSKYATFMTKGQVVPVTYTTNEYIPDEKGGDGTIREVELPEHYGNSKTSTLSKVKYHTVESVRELMLDLKKKQDEFRTKLKQLQEEKQAEMNAKKEEEEKTKLAQSVQNNLGGSAI